MFFKKLALLLVAALAYAPMCAYQLEGVTIYDRSNQSGTSETLLEGSFAGNQIPSSLNNSVTSLLVARGWRVRISENVDGSGITQVYRARNNEMRINLPERLNNSASFFDVQKVGGVRLFGDKNQSGPSVRLKEGIYRGNQIPGNLNNAISSIRVVRGFMVTLAENNNGTGYSVNYISRTEALAIDIPAQLNNRISYIRVIPWRDVRKKGVARVGRNNGSAVPVRMNADWWYNWNNVDESTNDFEYVPLRDRALDAFGTQRLTDKVHITHLNLFNEPDDTKPGGQPNDMTPSEAVGYHTDFLKTGFRLGSPAPKEGGVFRWLCEYVRGVKDNNERLDYLTVHWYDRAGWRRFQDPNASAEDVFERFQIYLRRVHEIYGLPIWITEFNANPNRLPRVQRRFLELALPWLDRQDYVERYSYFTCRDNCQYFNADGSLTEIGRLYRNHQSVLSIPEPNWQGPSLNTVSRPGNCDRFGSESNKNNNDSYRLEIAQNPVKTKIEIIGLDHDTLLQVYNTSGQKVTEYFGQSINVNNLAKGVYFLKLENQVLKFIK